MSIPSLDELFNDAPPQKISVEGKPPVEEISSEASGLDFVGEEASQLTDAVRYGLDQPLENIGITLEALGADNVGEWFREVMEAPENYEAASEKFINMQGDEYQQSYLPRAIIEQGGQLIGSLTARVAGAAVGGVVTANPIGAIVGAFAAPALFEAIQILGPTVQERLVRDGREGEEPTWEDWTAAGSAAGASGLLNAIGIRGLGNLNKHRALATVGATIKEGTTEGFQSITQELGSGVGTEEGIKPGKEIFGQAFGEAILGGTAAGTIQGGVGAYQTLTGEEGAAETFDQSKESLEKEIEEEAESEILASNTAYNNFEDLELDDIRKLITERGYEVPILASDTRESLQAKLNGFIKEDVQRRIYGEDAERNVLAPLKEPVVRKQQLNYFNELSNEQLAEYIETNIGLDEYQAWAKNQGEFSYDPTTSGEQNYAADRKALANAQTTVIMSQLNLPSKYNYNDYIDRIDELSERYDLATLQGMAQAYGGISQNQLNTYDKKGLATKIAEGMLKLEAQQLKTSSQFTEKSTFVETNIDFDSDLNSEYQRQISEEGNAISAIIEVAIDQGKTIIPLKFERLGAIQDPNLTLEEKLTLDGNLTLSPDQNAAAEKFLNDPRHAMYNKGETSIFQALEFGINTKLARLELPQGTLPQFNNTGIDTIFQWASWFRPYGPIGFELGRRRRENITRTRALDKNAQELSQGYEAAVQQVLKESKGDYTREELDKLGMAFLRRTGAKLKLDEDERANIEKEIQTLQEEKKEESSEDGKIEIQDEINELEIALEGVQRTAVAAEQLPKKMQAPLIKIRTSIDALSTRLLDLPIDLVPESDRVTIQEGINRYVTRSFALFEPGLGWNPRFSKKWLRSKSAQGLYDRAVESVYRTNIKKGIALDPNSAKPPTPEQIATDKRKARKVIDEIISLENIENSQDLIKLPNVFKSEEAVVGLEKAPANIVGKRGVIPKAVRELMGEIDDPAQVAATSLARLSRLVEMTSFYEDVRQINERPGEMFFSPVSTGAYKYKIEDNDYNPLSGQYTTKEIAETLGIEKKDAAGMSASFFSFYDPIFLVPKAAVQMGMIVLSPATQSRNFFGAGLMFMANGYLPGQGMAEVYETIKQDLFPGTAYKDGELTIQGREAQNLFRRMQHLGVVNTSVRLNDVSDLFSKLNSAGRNNTLSKWSHNLQAIKQTEPGQKVDFAAGSILRGLKNLYAASDDFWKMAAFTMDRKQMVKMLGNMRTNDGKPLPDEIKLQVLREYASTLSTKLGTEYKSNLDKSLRKSTSLEEYIDEVSAYHVRNGMPNYDYVGKFAQVVRQLPVGNFIAFPTEIIRTAFNLQQIAYKQGSFQLSPELMLKGNIQSKRPLVKNEDGSVTLEQPTGARPMTANSIQRYVLGGSTVYGLGYSMVAMAQYMFDVDDEELNAIRAIGPEYAKNTQLAPLSKIENGKGEVLNLNYILPYEGLARIGLTVMNALREGESKGQGIPASIAEGIAEWATEYASSYSDVSISVLAQAEITMNRDFTTQQPVYNTRDAWGDIASDIVSHITRSAAPGIVPQLGDVYRSMQEGDERYDKYLGDVDYLKAQMKLFGLSTTQVDASKSLPFTMSSYKRIININVEEKFKKIAYTGLPTMDTDVLNDYDKTQDIWFVVQQELYFDLQNYEKLGLKKSLINSELKRVAAASGVSKAFVRNIKKGIFTPFQVPKYVKRGFLQTRKKLIQEEKDAGRDGRAIQRAWPQRALTRKRNALMRADINLTAHPSLPEVE